MIEITATKHSYDGDGANAIFPVDFRYDNKSHVLVWVSDVAKTEGTHFTLTEAGVDEGGTLTFLAAFIPPAGTDNVVIERESPKKQLEQLPESGPFLTQTIELLMIDKLCMMIQELLTKFGTPEAGRYVGWDARGQDLTLLDAPVVGVVDMTPIVFEYTVVAGVSTQTITHSLNSLDVHLVGSSTTWHTTVAIISRTVNTIVVEFSAEAPPGNGIFTAEVVEVI